MKLYFSPGACSLASHIALNEAGLQFETIQVDLRAKKTKNGADFLKINPKGYVPTLETQTSEVLTEGAAILQYIADRAPEKDLAPRAGTFERYRMQEWLNFIATEVHKNFSPFWKPTTPEDYKQSLTQNLNARFDYLSNELQHRQFLMGSQFTIADAYLFTVLSWSKILKIDLTKWPTLMGYMERVSTRPAVRQALKSEGLI